MAELLQLILHPSTAAFCIGLLAGSQVTIMMLGKLRRGLNDSDGGRR